MDGKSHHLNEMSRPDRDQHIRVLCRIPEGKYPSAFTVFFEWMHQDYFAAVNPKSDPYTSVARTNTVLAETCKAVPEHMRQFDGKGVNIAHAVAQGCLWKAAICL